MRTIELLAPARTAEIAREAILHGADAVYLGAPRFGARAAAGNSLDDLRELVPFAHLYGVRVYVTLNTILFDDELDDVRLLAHQLYEMGVDALIVQDMAFLEMQLPPIPLHASTQMDIRSPQKVAWLYQLGFRQAVLARELTLEEVADIHKAVPEMMLEAFVHGATCVSFNGQCYASQYCFGRSANRGACAQFCRLPFDLVDEQGRVVCHPQTGEPIRQRHLLSLHDMNRSDDLEAMLDAGVVSLKIEGRLKDAAYVKNVVAYYRARLDDIIRRRPSDYGRSSVGSSSCSFQPQLDRTFNRGFSDYFLHGRSSNMVQLFSPKSVGQPVGHVKEIRQRSFTVSGTVPFANGDGLCFVDADGRLQGFRINRVEGNRIFPKDMPEGLRPRLPLFRNLDQAFTQQLEHPTATRRVAVCWTIEDHPLCSSASLPAGETETSVSLMLSSEDGVSVVRSFPVRLQLARSPQTENITRQLSRLGDTIYQVESVSNRLSSDWFIPSSLLAEWRRLLVEMLSAARQKKYTSNRLSTECQAPSTPPTTSAERAQETTDRLPLRSSFVAPHLSYLSNVSNRLARLFYIRQGAQGIEPALEVAPSSKPASLMTMRYCPRFELGLCKKQTHAAPNPLFLRASDGRLFPLVFDCHKCVVRVLPPSDHNR
ncbi:MAG: U32 family peptidase [Bacteroidales bacterium]|nr:U32 family peptidase [Candidatus Physcousia equi]